jgi:hypothetical protein
MKIQEAIRDGRRPRLPATSTCALTFTPQSTRLVVWPPKMSGGQTNG